MPIYEFRCEACGERFEALVAAGTDSVECRRCGSGRTARVLSAQAPPMHIVKTPGDTRKQEVKNAQLRERTRAEFTSARRRARERRPKGGSGG
ncbi:MAG TPA: zinc ribbon domain-containing protein [Solirubrobacterales bacterium]|nr:zinc ribbon domain-containing protein [Solirubrobacterales bacterium]